VSDLDSSISFHADLSGRLMTVGTALVDRKVVGDNQRPSLRIMEWPFVFEDAGTSEIRFLRQIFRCPGIAGLSQKVAK
jgi:hypothetical protein